MKRTVYADNAATAALSKKAFEAMIPYITTEYGNPSALCSYGRKAKGAVEKARMKVAWAIGALPEEIYFTSGGTESNNWAIKSAAEANKHKGKHIISTCIEHPAVLNVLKYLETQGYEVSYLEVDEMGSISIENLKQTIRKDTILITMMAVNNEIGTILPVSEVGSIALEKGILFHTDAIQAVGHIPVDINDMNVDFLSISAHKFRGPKGVGALFIRKGVSLPPFMHGGGQESSLRSGTQNVAGIVGLAEAIEEATTEIYSNMKAVSTLRDRLILGLLKIPYSRLTGDPFNRAPGIASFIFDFVEGESIVMMLDHNGICASSGSACSSGSPEPSHVLTSIGLPKQQAFGSLRLSINEDNSDEDIDYVLDVVPPIINRLREMSPLWYNKISEDIT